MMEKMSCESDGREGRVKGDSGGWKMKWNQRGRSIFISAVEQGMRDGLGFYMALLYVCV